MNVGTKRVRINKSNIKTTKSTFKEYFILSSICYFDFNNAIIRLYKINNNNMSIKDRKLNVCNNKTIFIGKHLNI